MPGAVATPESAEDVSSVIRWAARESVRVAIRGGGHSQGGQCLTDGGVALDTRRLNQVRPLGQGLVRAQGGATWIKVVAALSGTGHLPRVLTDATEVTVGGTLSSAGLGTTSHRYGLQIGQVEQLEVVVGTGERVRCSRDTNADLFNAVRGGQGHFGVITEAWIRLRKAGRRHRQYEFRYRDFERFASDLKELVKEGRFDHLRAEMRAHDRQIVLRAAAEYDDDLDHGKMLSGLGYDSMAIVWDTADVGHAGMFPTWGFRPTHYHPWRDWFLPWETLHTVLAQPWLDPVEIPRAPRSWTGIYPIATNSVDAPFFMHPKEEHMISYSILAVLDDVEKANALAARLRDITKFLVAIGGKSYLSGGVGYGHRQWQEHYGEILETGIGWKQVFDPHRILEGGSMTFGGSP
ncbi:MAG: FAD-binding protein [Alphaproteobacteria bacterium]|nr:FAD-binding protein [Alphaproteobacteria bacterium]